MMKRKLMKRTFMFLVAGVIVIYANATGVGNGVHVNIADSIYSGSGPNDTTYTGTAQAKCNDGQVQDVAQGAGLKYCTNKVTVYVRIKPSDRNESSDGASIRFEKTLTDAEAGHCSEGTAIVYDVSYDGVDAISATARSDCKPLPE